MKYWVNTISREHVLRGVEGGFTQANHGRAERLRRLGRADGIVFYSPRTSYPGGEALQKFTAIGCVGDDEPYKAEMTPTFHPWRRRVTFRPCREAPIQKLLEELEFVPDKRRWGFPFRRGLFEIGAADFGRIAAAMEIEPGGL